MNSKSHLIDKTNFCKKCGIEFSMPSGTYWREYCKKECRKKKKLTEQFISVMPKSNSYVFDGIPELDFVFDQLLSKVPESSQSFVKSLRVALFRKKFSVRQSEALEDLIYIHGVKLDGK